MRGIWSGLGGIITVIALIAAFAFIGDGMPDDPAELASYLEDFQGLVVHALIVVAAAGLVWFATALHQVSGSLVAMGSMIAGAALLLVSDVALLAPSEAAEVNTFTPEVSSLETWDTAAYFALTNAHVLVGLAAIAFGAEVLRRSFPAWLGWFSVVTGAIGLASAAFFPMLVLWLWLVVTGAVLMSRPIEVAEPREQKRASRGRMTA